MRSGKLPKETLIDLYITQRLDCVQIGRMVGRDPKSVWAWLKSYGIETRKRGHSSAATQFQKGENSNWLGRKHKEVSKEKVRQARIREGSVPYLQNGQHWLKGKPRGTVASWRGGITPERQAFYTSPQWREAVKQVWQRDNATCQRCALDHRNIDRGTVKFHIHHIVSFSIKELRAEVSNLVLLCDRCHRFVHSKGNHQRLFLREDHTSLNGITRESK